MLFIFSVPGFAQNPDPIMWWDFSSVNKRTTIEKQSGVADTLEILLSGSSDSPVHNPAFLIKNWNAEGAEVFVNGKSIEDSRTGINHELEVTDQWSGVSNWICRDVL